ncbi:IS1380 family transposase [Halosquirtibacter xylanolyticus]|uniref:IS1380 family transposase n=1 Tax=Halosquirtibacter xylanolyticus TaxID=3374599 RepID=UPI00374A3925|nr:IS1380 family transposase [Prolixibacteraceae bacterium]QZT37248.1 IS1380 family transposase [Prolixibacteraceae bacterium]
MSTITKIGISRSKLSDRAGLSLIMNFIKNIGFYSLVSNKFLSKIAYSGYGLTLESFFCQMVAHFIDGTHSSICSFDRKKLSASYAPVIGIEKNELASSFQIKRFIVKLSQLSNSELSEILNELFIWRLLHEKPKVIVLGVDTMVMDNNYSEKKEDNKPTYKKVKGFQPLHISWENSLIDVLFRPGNHHSNHGNDYTERVKHIVDLIRSRYSESVPIIVCSDSGFLDEKAFNFFDQLNISFITTGKMYKDITSELEHIKRGDCEKYTNGTLQWDLYDFGNKLKSWSKFWRCIATSLSREEDGQRVLDLSGPDNLIYTNIGKNKISDERLKKADMSDILTAKGIVQLSHHRGADELIHRSLKELATTESLPFKKFNQNKVYYYILAMSHSLFEAYKNDISYDKISAKAYPNTFRRKLIDFAGEIVEGGRNTTLRIAKEVQEEFEIKELWERCLKPPIVLFTAA